MITLDPPVLVTVSDRGWALPTCTLPKSRLVGFAPIAPGATPVPERVIDNAGFTAFEVIARAPLVLPADWGVKVTVNVVFAPVFSARGVEIPLRLNPLPLTKACEMVILDAVLLVSVTV